ncbi:hypothetical protein POVCU2_0051350 [Plasmodium ovale curtisi]|uniref:Uncharacterized protein n=1 Tax=Plasmodium ovale curtisi TaxID=864141 RepID=A0A1A8W7G1_PLAOA|nr:hypothetical protein POVCU2_0051350 [Plasmodium ovale curtisi]
MLASSVLTDDSKCYFLLHTLNDSSVRITIYGMTVEGDPHEDIHGNVKTGRKRQGVLDKFRVCMKCNSSSVLAGETVKILHFQDHAFQRRSE